MWIKIDVKEFLNIRLAKVSSIVSRDESDWCDFQEIVWTDVNTCAKVLKETIQDNYDEVADYPPTITYYKWRE